MYPPPSTAGVGTCPPLRAGWWPPPSGGGHQPSPTTAGTRPPPSGGGSGRGRMRHIAPSQRRTRVSSPSSSDSTFWRRSQRSSCKQIQFNSSSTSTSHSASPDHSHRRVTKGEGRRRRKSSSSSSSSSWIIPAPPAALQVHPGAGPGIDGVAEGGNTVTVTSAAAIDLMLPQRHQSHVLHQCPRSSAGKYAEVSMWNLKSCSSP